MDWIDDLFTPGYDRRKSFLMGMIDQSKLEREQIQHVLNLLDQGLYDDAQRIILDHIDTRDPREIFKQIMKHGTRN